MAADLRRRTLIKSKGDARNMIQDSIMFLHILKSVNPRTRFNMIRHFRVA